MEYRYRDKAYLSNYTLDTTLFDKFDFLVEDVIPIRSVYILKTDKGMKVLKKVMYDIDELNFIYDSLSYIRKTYENVVNFRLSSDGNSYVKDASGLYVVLDIIDGRECVFENPVDLKNASRHLAKLHRAGENIETFHEKRFKVGRILEKYNTALDNLKKFKEIASMHVNKKEFDKLYLSYADYYINCIYSAIECIKQSQYIKYSRNKYVLCHHDLAHHNIIIDNDNEVHFLDFDYSLIDLPMHDISNIIIKAIKHNRWDIDIGKTIIKSYGEEKPLSSEELDILYGYLLFPKDFYDISTSYYFRNRDWEEEEFLEKLKRKAEYREDREKFLDNYKRYF
ncbi:CotS family spore coat protein [Clostridium cylindrosporum]|uniref:Spore coat protein, CotS family n=1 Tax=Clostridium cylindrosporum DSM 605 TaxID=1121307 RepID=A0A0J8G594_CLOCY|nr:CotS family spore coat protein [Clostridium cylindrosporum]KMT22831.1 spore coat protein, CotS family [Clostridium cylindrosporum DSM 605]